MYAKTIFFSGSIFLLSLSVITLAQTNRIWATYFGGNNTESVISVGTDPSGHVYLAGLTVSTMGIASPGAYQSTLGGNQDIFIAKFNTAGTRLWSTYFGGAGAEFKLGFTVDNSGNVYVCGYTENTTGLATAGSHQTTFGGGTYDAFLVKFNTSGSRVWSTYYGGSVNETAYAVSADLSGNVYMAGHSNSTSAISTPGSSQPACNGCSLFSSDAFLVKFNSSGVRQWATYYGGTDNEYCTGVATDASGNVYLTGRTFSSNGIATAGAFKTTLGGTCDGYLVKYNASGVKQWATYYGGTLNDMAFSVVTDGSGNVYFAGQTESTSGIATTGSFQSSYSNGNSFTFDAFLVKFSGTGSRIWGTYYGGTAQEEQYNLAIDNAGNVYLAGDSYSSTGIASGGYQNNLNGTENVFVAKFNSNGNRIVATYYGGGPEEEDGHTTVDANGNVYLAGYTGGSPGMVTPGAYQTTFNGIVDAFLVKFGTPSPLPVTIVSFKGWNEGKNNILTWSTASEINNDYFELQRKSGSEEFETITTINGHGTTTTSNTYSFKDVQIFPGQNYFYRLRQVDFNGQSSYSKIIEVKTLSSELPFTAAPNPFSGSTNIFYTIKEGTNVTLEIFSVTGKEISVIPKSIQGAGTYKYTFSAERFGLPSGIYIARLTTGDKTQHIKLIQK